MRLHLLVLMLLLLPLLVLLPLLCGWCRVENTGVCMQRSCCEEHYCDGVTSSACSGLYMTCIYYMWDEGRET